MQSKVVVGLALAVGFLIGAQTAQAPRASVLPHPAYFVSETLEQLDPAAHAKALDDSAVLHKAYGAKFLVRSGKVATISGDAPKRMSIIAFESFDQAKQFYGSPEYLAIQSRIRGAAKSRTFIVEGLMGAQP